jgi:hypothetical protein
LWQVIFFAPAMNIQGSVKQGNTILLRKSQAVLYQLHIKIRRKRSPAKAQRRSFHIMLLSTQKYIVMQIFEVLNGIRKGRTLRPAFWLF